MRIVLRILYVYAYVLVPFSIIVVFLLEFNVYSRWVYM